LVSRPKITPTGYNAITGYFSLKGTITSYFPILPMADDELDLQALDALPVLPRPPPDHAKPSKLVKAVKVLKIVITSVISPSVAHTQ